MYISTSQFLKGFRLSWTVVVFGLLVCNLQTNRLNAQGNANARVFPPHSSPHGADYAVWSARQWQWTFSLPATTHPLFDSADCSQGQSGNVWFLGGTFSTTDSGGVVIGSANRTCGIPAGTALLFPLINVECSTIEGNGSIEADLRGCARLLANQIIPSSLFLRIDDKPVTNLADYRVESPLFNFGPLPAGNILQFFGLEAPAGTTSPCVSDGYLVMVKPLPVGVHTLHFGGTADLTPVGGPIFKQDIRYTLTVQPRGRY